MGESLPRAAVGNGAGTARGAWLASPGSLVSSKSPPGPGPWFLSVLCSSGPWERVCEGVGEECLPMSAPARTERGNTRWDSTSFPLPAERRCRPRWALPAPDRVSVSRRCPAGPLGRVRGSDRSCAWTTGGKSVKRPDRSLPPSQIASHGTLLIPDASNSTHTQGLAFSLPVPGLPVGGDGGTAERRGRPVAGSEMSLQRDRGRGPCFPSVSPDGFKTLHLNLLVK